MGFPVSPTNRKEAFMHHIHLVGCPSALFDNLTVSWQERLASFEISQFDPLGAIMDQIHSRRPQWVVYCGRAARSSWEASSDNYADDPTHIELLTRAVTQVDARLLLISSDRATAGPRMFHDENDPAGDDLQAQLLHAVEQAALRVDGERRRVLVVRTNAIGWSASGETFAERIWHSMEAREPVELDSSSFATPILASDLCELLLRCVRARLCGLLHIGGAERTSPFRFAQELARAAGFDHRLVRASAGEIRDGEAVVCTCETSMASRLVRRELNIPLPLLRESASRFIEQATGGFRDRLREVATVARAKAA
jgi:dTDP-4-dehydrorhamnose reductase